MEIKEAFISAFSYRRIHSDDDKKTKKDKIIGNFIKGSSYIPVVGFFGNLSIFILGVFAHKKEERPFVAFLGLRTVCSMGGPLILPIADIAACILNKVDPKARSEKIHKTDQAE